MSRSLPRGLPLAFLIVCAWAWWQGQPAAPSAWHHPLWALTSDILGEPMVSGISLAGDDGYTALLRYLSYGLVFFLAFQLCRDIRRAETLFRWLAAAGLAYAIYGLAIFWSGTDRFLWFWELDWLAAVRGTFVNRNSFATWLGLTLLCTVTVFYRGMTRRRNPAYRLPHRDQAPLLQTVEQFMVRSWRSLAMLMVMTAALILTHSRGGFLSALAGAMVLLLLLDRRHHQQGLPGQGAARLRTRAVLVSVLMTSLVVFWITSTMLLTRMDRAGAAMGSRIQAYTLASDGIEDNPLLGFGYGTFADSFRLYRDESLPRHFDKAHNTYLENIFELGWPVALLQFALVAWLAWICWRGLHRRRRDWVFPATGLAATTLVAVHSLADFSLQMPATALAYAGLMGAAVAQSYPVRHT